MRELDRLSIESIEQVLKDSLRTLETIENQEHKGELIAAIVYAKKLVGLII